jgi:hypothetical protein
VRVQLLVERNNREGVFLAEMVKMVSSCGVNQVGEV